MEALGLNLGYLIVQILNFIVIFLVLKAWVYKPILGMLEHRREAISNGLEDARVASDARGNAQSEAERIISDAQKQSAQIVREASNRAEVAAQEIRTKAETDATHIRDTARSEIEQERHRNLQELRGQVATLAIAAAQKLIGESLMQDKARQQALVDEFFSGIKAGKVVILEGIEALKEATVEVTSALPLNTTEQDKIKKDFLTSSVGKSWQGKAEFNFRVNPTILGGLIIRVGDRVLDGSVSGQLQGLHQNL